MNTVPEHVRSITMMGRHNCKWQAAVWYHDRTYNVHEAKTLDQLMQAIEADIKRNTPPDQPGPHFLPPSIA